MNGVMFFKGLPSYSKVPAMMLELVTTVGLVSFSGTVLRLIFKGIFHLLFYHRRRHEQFRCRTKKGILLSIPDAPVFSIFVLVSQDHDVRSDDTGKPIVGEDLPFFAPVFVGTE
jgi:hypothetical protein